MKRIHIFFFVVIGTLYSLSLHGENEFYYGNEEKISITIVQNKRALLRQPVREREDYVERIGARIQIVSVETSCNENSMTMYKIDDKISLPIINIANETEAVLLPEIILKQKNPSNDISLLCKKYKLTLIKDTKRYQVYSVPITSNVISIANEMYETGLFDYAYPNSFCSSVQTAYIPNDSYFQYQIAYHNTSQVLPNGHSGTANADINAPEAWEITKGSPDIIVAVLDEGVTSNHPDLPDARQIRLNGSNFGTGNPNDPSPSGNDNHGNACAGVIAATMDNNQGITGIAPNCKIMPIRKDSTSSQDDIADAFYLAMDNGAHIISNSWTYRFQNPNFFPAVRAAIDTVLHHNIVVVFSAGNTANHANNNNGYVNFPANFFRDSLITVGASDRYDHMANYSPKSSFIDFVAPSHRAYSSQISGETLEMWTLDIPGSTGYNPIPTNFPDSFYSAGTMIPSSGTNYLAYTGCFGGTSHSCPVVAGVVALMLSVNPYLTPAEVFDILKETSDKVGGYTYVNGKCNEMGYGRVNAYAAVSEAKSRYIQGPDYVCVTAKYYFINAPENATFSWSIDNGSLSFPQYSIIGSSTLDTVLVKGTYVNIRGNSEDENYTSDLIGREVPFPNLTKSLSVIVTNNGTSETYTRILIHSDSEVPTISASSTNTLWLSQTSRTFTVTNCIGVPDSLLQWTVIRKGTTPPPPMQPTLYTYNYYGRTLTYSPPTPPSISRPDTLTVYATNLAGVCGSVNSDTLRFVVIPKKILLNGNVDGQQLDITIMEDSEDSQRLMAQLDEDSNYSLELWHSIYGAMRIQTADNAHEQMNISGLPQGIYVLSLKENGIIIAQTKIQIE